MHVWNLKGVELIIGHVFVKVILGWHVVSLMPVSLPLPKDWESEFKFEANTVLLSTGVGCRNVTNVIIVIKSVDVAWEGSSYSCDGIGPVIWVNVWLVVYS